ncbi:MAG: ABC transporter, partial [Oscillospiraceae bacterium]|nr:ABC transporter [Oscillospiraceae bacterium]
CDHILIINRGKLLANDTAENLERNLLGDESLKLELAASESEVKSLLSKINGVNNCIITTDEGVTHVTIPCKHGFDPRIDVFNACAKANCPILSMEYAKSTLEQVFLKLTQSSTGKH